MVTHHYTTFCNFALQTYISLPDKYPFVAIFVNLKYEFVPILYQKRGWAMAKIVALVKASYLDKKKGLEADLSAPRFG